MKTYITSFILMGVVLGASALLMGKPVWREHPPNIKTSSATPQLFNSPTSFSKDYKFEKIAFLPYYFSWPPCFGESDHDGAMEVIGSFGDGERLFSALFEYIGNNQYREEA